eukprot:930860-Alexandrium_andersonii.AAC.1
MQNSCVRALSLVNSRAGPERPHGLPFGRNAKGLQPARGAFSPSSSSGLQPIAAPVRVARTYKNIGRTTAGPSARRNSFQGPECPYGLPGLVSSGISKGLQPVVRAFSPSILFRAFSPVQT